MKDKEKQEPSFLKNADIVARKIADEMILVPVKGGVGELNAVYTLNDLGARIWELIDGNKKLSEIVDMLCDESDVDRDVALADTVDFLRDLEAEGLIEAA